MKRKLLVSITALVLGFFTLFSIGFVNGEKSTASADSYNFVVNNYDELKNAMAQASASKHVTIVLACDIEMKEDLTAKGLITIKANGGEKLIFQSGTSKRGIGFSKNTTLSLEGVTIERSVVDETEKFLFATYEKGISLSFTDCVFNVATAEIASLYFHR